MDSNVPFLIGGALVLTAELAFYFWFRSALRAANATSSAAPTVPRQRRDELVERLIALAQRHGVAKVLSGWFIDKETGAPPECGRMHGHLQDFIAWALLDKTAETLDEEERKWVAQANNRMIDQINIQHTETKEGKLLSHTLDPVIARHRPLCLYMLVWTVQLCAGSALRILGFSQGERQGVHFWYRAANSTEGEPVVFFHGIGPGPVFYLPLLARLTDREMLIVELPWISMRPWITVPRDTETYAKNVLAIIDEFKMRKDERRLVLVGHSYGSVPIAWLMRTTPDLKCRLVLIDPVTLYIIVPKVCYSFLYEEPQGLFSRVIRHWASEEIGVAVTLRRGFYWTDCVQFAEDLPADTQVFLSAQDHIVPVDIVHDECMRHKHIAVTTFPDIGHGGPCTVPAYARLVTQAIKN